MSFSSTSRGFSLLGYFQKSTRAGVILASMAKRKPLPLGLEVYFVDDDRLRYLGKLVDIIGNIEKPYAVVKPDEALEVPPGTPLYYREKRLKKTRRVRGRGR